MALVFIIFLRLRHFQYLTGFNYIYLIAILIYLSPKSTTGSRNLKESAKVSCREGIHVVIPIFMLIVQGLARLEVAVALN